MSIIDSQASKFLGKNTQDYNLEYNPDLLVNIERKHNREAHKIGPLNGFDIWHNYEVSFLLNCGVPLTYVAKIKIPCNSKYFIESKSMKLYFFSFNMKKMGKNPIEARENFLRIVKEDFYYKIGDYIDIALFDAYNAPKEKFPFTEFLDLSDSFIYDEDFSHYKESPELLEFSGRKAVFNFYFSGFRSNCRVTHQPDFSTIFISSTGNMPTYKSLMKYLVSFRNEYHFHEEVTEQIFQAIMNKIKPDSLAIYNLFTRRGGIDICPVRHTENAKLVDLFGNAYKLTESTIYQ